MAVGAMMAYVYDGMAALPMCAGAPEARLQVFAARLRD
jgi:hypothetical protein